MRRRGATTTIAGKSAAVYVTGHTIEGLPLCPITTPVFLRRSSEPMVWGYELGKLMLAHAPKLGKAMADLLCREIDAYRDGTVVTKDQVAESCVANVTFIFDSLAGSADVDVSPAEHTGTA